MSLTCYTNSSDIAAASSNNCESKGCGVESARALKRILGLLDNLNNDDLRLLEDIIERLLCSRK
ncbi:hypothetical protein [Caproiciproducens galactitolivorans]|uniref:Uncharacterized protein n=1 Tax=Caproiciproducens galactitolivorans TaxID=642589 RepID=A0A4Z0YH00_9FIRM|nr:hypothetical protein [Caproiciproducens galactitolivorans]TGJ78023.1 hypothetical protein CAGA_04330 [Caproiciproducens galactitolivorans]